jgi:hypothetical protein
MPEHGPFETEDDARMTPAVRAIWETIGTTSRPRLMDELNLRMLDEACVATGIDAGEYGHRILAWLANMEPQTCVVFADLIIRAHEAGKAATMEGAVTEWGARFRDPAGRLSSMADCGRGADGERTARDVAGTSRKDDLTGIVLRRQVGPWKEATDV